MSVAIISAVWEFPVKPAARKLVLVALADHADVDGNCFPSSGRLSERCGMSARSVQRHIDELCEDGYMSKIERRRRPDGTLGTWLYKVHTTPVSPSESHTTSVAEPHDICGSHHTTSVAEPHDTSVAAEPSLNHHDEPSLNRHPQISAQPTPAASSDVDVFDDMFEAFWDAYPRKVGKPSAKRTLRTALKDAEPQQIGDGLRAWVGYWQRSNTEPRFIPHPATWLNQQRFNDPPPASAVPESAAERVARINQLRNKGTI